MGMVAHACNPREVRQEEQDFQAILDCIVTPVSKEKKKVMATIVSA
jgi:hypothetical protein